MGIHYPQINIMTGASNKYPQFMGKRGKLSFMGDFKKMQIKCDNGSQI